MTSSECSVCSSLLLDNSCNLFDISSCLDILSVGDETAGVGALDGVCAEGVEGAGVEATELVGESVVKVATEAGVADLSPAN
jgi:hypothetical protein